MTLEAFVDAYQAALATQRWELVDPLMHADACVTFSSGEVHRGKDAVRAAFERNFAAIKDETYLISGVHWILRTSDVAVYAFTFDWTGTIEGRAAAGGGRGTSVLVRDGGAWKLIAEHLGARQRT